ncbi:MAG: hypothetical protein GY778_26655 [bacterium]|nr:hypothetical protein [bacterium]
MDLSWRGIFIAVLLVPALVGCQKRGEAEPFGKTFYVGGASNWDVFTSGVPGGLRDAGYRGDVESFIWTMSFNPLIDQLITVNAKSRASALASQIKNYQRRYPDRQVNIIALSAGTGVAVWSLERLDSDTRIDNLILLGSSLSAEYDIRKALRHVSGKIYVFHSPHDAVLQTVKVVGTIDGKLGVESIGLVGTRGPGGGDDQVVNTAWSRKYMRYGWAGGHTDCTNSRFVKHILGPIIVNGSPTQTAEGDPTDRDRPVASTHQ